MASNTTSIDMADLNKQSSSMTTPDGNDTTNNSTNNSNNNISNTKTSSDVLSPSLPVISNLSKSMLPGLKSLPPLKPLGSALPTLNNNHDSAVPVLRALNTTTIKPKIQDKPDNLATSSTLSLQPIPIAMSEAQRLILLEKQANNDKTLLSKDDLNVSEEDILKMTDRIDFLRRDDITTYLNYKKPLVQESRQTKEENDLMNKSNEISTETKISFIQDQDNNFIRHTSIPQTINEEDATLEEINLMDTIQATNLEFQNLINNYLLFLHGILAGISILHLYFVYNRTSDLSFVSYYSGISFGIRFMFQMIVAVCTVSSLSRFMLVFKF